MCNDKVFVIIYLIDYLRNPILFSLTFKWVEHITFKTYFKRIAKNFENVNCFSRKRVFLCI